MNRQGHIYILRNPSLKDSLVKVGRTSRVSEVRAREISKATGVPFDFEVLYEQFVADTHLAEKLIHKELERYRMNPRREFFLVPLKIAVRSVFEVCRQIELISTGNAQPLIVFYGKSARDASRLRAVLEPHRGGNTRVTVVYASATAVAEFDLGSDWFVNLSVELVRDIKRKFGADDVWTWDTREGEPSLAGDNLEDDIPF